MRLQGVLLLTAACAVCPKLCFVLQVFLQAEVQLQGHLLVCSNGTPPSALFCLLAPLRSCSLPALQPVVLLDSSAPSGLEWQHIARCASCCTCFANAKDDTIWLSSSSSGRCRAHMRLDWQHIARLVTPSGI
jgi:hypothetical protein